MNTSFILMALSASALPLLAVLALFLRQNIFTGKWKVLFLTIGISLLFFTIFDTFREHGEDLGLGDIVVGAVTALITVFILSRFNNHHTHNTAVGGAQGIVISEAFHSLIDGAVIGATYIVSPILGYAATVGIIIHELPKIIGMITILRSLGLSVRKTIIYGMVAQIGSPVSAILIYMLGKEINHDQFHLLEIASVSSLASIVLWIIYLEIRYHKKHDHSDGANHSH
jgi:zinc and cadmium transporter